MKMRTLGRVGPSVSAFGLGCMRMSNFPGGPPPSLAADEESVATIEAALDAGITLLNTGDFYGVGHNETIVAKAIKQRRGQAFLSVKCGALWSPSGAYLGPDCRPTSIKNFASYSLARLGVDVIDLYQVGRADPSVPYEETIGAIADLVAEGKVRYVGVSEITADQLRRAHKTHPIAAVEVEYSLACRFIEAEILPTARELGVGVIPYRVVTQGLLAGTIKSEQDVRGIAASFPRFQGENLKENLQAVGFLERLAKNRECTSAQLALAWVLSKGEDFVPVIGMSRRSRLPENLHALEIVLTSDEKAELERVFAPGAIKGDRYPRHYVGLDPVKA